MIQDKVLDIPYDVRDYFFPLHTRDQRWGICVAHRRAGKTVAAINDIVSNAVYNERERSRYAYIAPFYSQAKQIAWDYLKQYTVNIADKVRESSLSVDLFNGNRITLYGADNPDAFRGVYFDGVVIDEYGDCKPNLWTEVLRPALADRGGWGLFIGTPNGLNHFFDLWNFALAHPESWYVLSLPYNDTNILAVDEIEEMRGLMTSDEFAQEMECSFQAPTRGSFYGEALQTADIGEYPLIRELPANYVFDIGYTDTTAIWRYQSTEDKIRFSLTYEQEARSVEFFATWLHAQRESGIMTGEVWLPHDAKAKSFQTGRSTIEQFLSYGVRPRIVPKLDLLDGIQAARQMLPVMQFDEAGCRDGILALRAYRRKFNQETQQYINRPLHDWSSNYADSFRYAALIAKLKEKKKLAVDLTAPRQLNYGFSMNDLWKLAPTKEHW